MKTVNGEHAQKTVGAAEHRFRLRWFTGLAGRATTHRVDIQLLRPASARVGVLVTGVSGLVLVLATLASSPSPAFGVCCPRSP